MPAFERTTDLYSYFRQNAQELNCNPCFDNKQTDIEAMNEKGRDGKPGCLCCAVFVACPCGGAKGQIERDGECHCGIFQVK